MEGKSHSLILGKSFAKNSSVAFHSIRYDFKPASVDMSKVSTMEIEKDKAVSVSVPHVEGSKETVYKGSKRPLQKECILIVNNRTGEVRLEKLSSHIGLKKTRLEGTSKAQNVPRPVTPVEVQKNKDSEVSSKKSEESKDVSASWGKKLEDTQVKNSPSQPAKPQAAPAMRLESLGLTLSDDSSEESDSSSDDEGPTTGAPVPVPFTNCAPIAQVRQLSSEAEDEEMHTPIPTDRPLEDDLKLSDSDSDDD